MGMCQCSDMPMCRSNCTDGLDEGIGVKQVVADDEPPLYTIDSGVQTSRGQPAPQLRLGDPTVWRRQEAKAIADQVRALVGEGTARAWARLAGELELQKLHWQSAPFSQEGGERHRHIYSSLSMLQAKLDYALQVWVLDPEQAVQSLESVLQQHTEQYGSTGRLLSEAMVSTIKAALFMEHATSARQLLVEHLEAISRGAGEGAALTLEPVLRAASLTKLRTLEARARKVLGVDDREDSSAAPGTLSPGGSTKL